jgi:hypothetical protein
VVHGDERAVWSPHASGGEFQSLECLGRSYFVDEVTVNVKEGGAISIGDCVVTENLVVKRSRFRGEKGGGGGAERGEGWGGQEGRGGW